MFVVFGVSTRLPLKYIIWLVILSIAVIIIPLWVTVFYYPQFSDLWILFLLTLPAEFIIAVVPHEPILFYFSKNYDPLIVTGVSVTGTLIIEYINYVLVKLFSRIKRIEDVKNHHMFQKTLHYFLLAPFISLLVAALTPIPFYPFRILAPLSGYSVKKYLTAIFLGRAPRFYILAYFGYIVRFSNTVIVVLFILLFIIVIIHIKREREKTQSMSG